MDRYLRHPSRPAYWSGTELAPVEELSTEVEVWAGWAEDNTRLWEAFNAIPVDGGGGMLLRSVPAYAYGLNYGDTVHCVASAEGPLVIAGVASFGGQATFRISLGADTDPYAWRQVAESYAARGCLVDVLSVSLIALSCALEDSDAIQRLLEGDAVQRGLEWEAGTTTS